MKPKIILVLALCLMLISPSMAITITAEPLGGNLNLVSESDVSSYTYDSTSEGRGIQRISIDVPTDTEVTYTLTYGDGSTLSGTYHYYNAGFYTQTSDITLGAESSTFTYVGVQEMGRIYITGYARNDTSNEYGIVVGGTSFGVTTWSSDYVFVPVSSSEDIVIYKLQFTSTKPVQVAILTNPRAEVAEAATKSLLDLGGEFLESVKNILEDVTEFVFILHDWLVFLWDNKVLIFALYIGITAAVAFNQSRDIFAALKKFFGYQRKIFEFFIDMWTRLIEIVSYIRGIFRI